MFMSSLSVIFLATSVMAQDDRFKAVTTFTVIEGSESGGCVAEGIAKAINDASGKFENVTATNKDLVVTIQSYLIGVPFTITVTTSNAVDSEFVLYANSVPNQPSMSTPDIGVSNSLSYETIERGGEYRAVLTVVLGCDYSDSEISFFSWCYDLTSFDCCFASLTENSCCDGCAESSVFKASKLRNIIKAISLMGEQKYDNNRIQKVVDCGWTICDPTNCGGGCDGC